MTIAIDDVDEIYHQMAVIRRERHKNVRESVAGAEAFMDWGRYTWTYPWITLGAAVAIGGAIYTSVHQRGAAGNASPDNGGTSGDPIAGVSGTIQGRSRIGPNLLLTAWEILFPVGVRAGQNLLLHWLEQQYSTTTVHRPAPSPSPGERRA